MADLVELVEVGPDNWRDVASVAPHPAQQSCVADTTYYLCLSFYEGTWRSLAIVAAGTVVGHVMWAYDPEDQYHFIGGLVVDATHQREGLGRATVEELLRTFEGDPRYVGAALTFRPDNRPAATLYHSLGFVETGEVDGDEVVARRPR